MLKVDSVQFDQYSSMGNNLTDFEACYSFTALGNFRSVRHCHDFYELFIHYRGGRRMEIDQSTYDMEPNQLYIIPPFSMHQLLANSEEDYERAFLYIHSEALKTCGCGQIDPDLLFQARVSSGNHCYSLPSASAARCKELMLQLRENQRRDDPLARFRDYSLLLPLLEIMCEAVFSPAVSLQPAAPSAMRDILNYVNENYMNPLRVETLAQHFGVSVSYMAHEFKKYTGRSVYDYVLHRRVMLAKKLILDSPSLYTVSEQCGFENYSNFLRLFYKYVGVSPSAYKKSLKL